MVRAFQIGSYQIGVIKFSSRVYTEFNLNTYSTQDDIINAIDDIDYYGGGTYTHLALEKLIDEAFLPSNGGRGASIPKVCKAAEFLLCDPWAITKRKYNSGDKGEKNGSYA